MAGPVEKRGLLIVHGIGQQKRFDHLKTTVLEFAELIRQFKDPPRVSVLDRTDGWKLAPGEPDPASGAPVSLTLIFPDNGPRDIEFECHEVWWADLGAKSGVGEVLTFWIWSLGQWGAPIYESLDCAQVRKQGLVRMPPSVAGHFRSESWARFKLAAAALAAIFTLATWSIAKRLFSALLGQLPSPVLIEQYIGDVRTYEQRAMPGHADIADPGLPLRVGIRRRMVTEMVAMAMRDIESWHVVAHSQGSVLAYNGLTEIGHTLPNYLTERLWNQVKFCLGSDPGCVKRPRENLPSMIPSRPGWLDYDDAINRPALFAKLEGILTYGSPLQKFAALWPRIIATATDRNDGKRPFRSIAWVNLAAPHDPVAGLLESCDTAKDAKDIAQYLPRLVSHATPLGFSFGIAHINYFKGEEKAAEKSIATRQKDAAVQWLLDGKTGCDLEYHRNAVVTQALVWNGNAVILFVLWLAATLVFTLGHGVASSLAGFLASAPARPMPFVAVAFCRNLLPVAGLALSLIAACGLYRWARESHLNQQLALGDPEQESYRPLFKLQKWASLMSSLAMGALLVAMLVAEFAIAEPVAGISYLVAAGTIAVAIVLQAWINLVKMPPKASPRDKDGKALQDASNSRPVKH